VDRIKFHGLKELNGDLVMLGSQAEREFTVFWCCDIDSKQFLFHRHYASLSERNGITALL